MFCPGNSCVLIWLHSLRHNTLGTERILSFQSPFSCTVSLMQWKHIPAALCRKQKGYNAGLSKVYTKDYRYLDLRMKYEGKFWSNPSKTLGSKNGSARLTLWFQKNLPGFFNWGHASSSQLWKPRNIWMYSIWMPSYQRKIDKTVKAVLSKLGRSAISILFQNSTTDILYTLNWKLHMEWCHKAHFEIFRGCGSGS